MKSRVARVAALALCAGLGFARAGRGNDTAFRGAPADLVPLGTTPVQMASEAIVLSATHAEWSVEARYTFVNPSAADVRLTVGFPELPCLSDPDYPCGHNRFLDFKTWVDGKEVRVRQGKLAKNEVWADYVGVIWLYEAVFPAKASVSIEHRYRLATGEVSSGERFTQYITRTGRPWAGSIGHARFTARLPPYTGVVTVSKVKGLVAEPPRAVNATPPYVEVVLEGRDWEPEGDLEFRFDPGARAAFSRAAKPSSYGDYDMLANDTSAEGTLELLRLVHAAKGYPFRSPGLRDSYYATKPEFQPVSAGDAYLSWSRGLLAVDAFDPAWFAREDRQLLAGIEKQRSTLGLSMDFEETAPPSNSAAAPPAAAGAPAAVAAPAASKGNGDSPGALGHSGCRCDLAASTRERGSVLPFALFAWLAVLACRRRAQRAGELARRSKKIPPLAAIGHTRDWTYDRRRCERG